MFKGLALLSTLLTALVFVIAGIFYIIGVVGSDVCYSPYESLASFVASGTDTASVTLKYYLTCDASTGITGTVLQTISDSKNTIAAQLAQITGSLSVPPNIPNWSPNGSPAYQTAVALLASNGASVTASNGGLSLIISDVLSCAAVGNVIDPLLTAICGGAITSAIGIARILIAAGVLLFVQLAIGVDVCCYHPGDPNAWVEASDLRLREAVPGAESINAGGAAAVIPPAPYDAGAGKAPSAYV